MEQNPPVQSRAGFFLSAQCPGVGPLTCGLTRNRRGQHHDRCDQVKPWGIGQGFHAQRRESIALGLFGFIKSRLPLTRTLLTVESLFWGEFFLDVFDDLAGVIDAPCFSKQIPHIARLLFLGDALATGVAIPKLALPTCISLIRSLAIPLHSFSVVLGDARADVIAIGWAPENWPNHSSESDVRVGRSMSGRLQPKKKAARRPPYGIWISDPQLTRRRGWICRRNGGRGRLQRCVRPCLFRPPSGRRAGRRPSCCRSRRRL